MRLCVPGAAQRLLQGQLRLLQLLNPSSEELLALLQLGGPLSERRQHRQLLGGGGEVPPGRVQLPQQLLLVPQLVSEALGGPLLLPQTDTELTFPPLQTVYLMGGGGNGRCVIAVTIPRVTDSR